MTEYSREERGQHFGRLLRAYRFRYGEDGDYQAVRDCVPVPTSYLDQLERALWELMRAGGEGYPSRVPPFYSEVVLREIGFQEAYTWTPAAHEFAARMSQRKETT